jgi:hypothetical protein
MSHTVEQINAMAPGSVLLRDGRDALVVVLVTPWNKNCEICHAVATDKICKWEIEGKVNSLLLCPACAVEEIIEKGSVGALKTSIYMYPLVSTKGFMRFQALEMLGQLRETLPGATG